VIQYYPKVKRFHVSAIDSDGKTTSSITLSYEDLYSVLREDEDKFFIGEKLL